MPMNALVLSTAYQHDVIQVWARVEADPNYPKNTRKFLVFATGEGFEIETLDFIGRVETKDGLVYHVFEDWSV